METLFKIVGFVVLASLFVVAVSFIFSLPVMWLWNWLMPDIFGLKIITWTQALGMSLLCGFLFKSSTSSANKS